MLEDEHADLEELRRGQGDVWERFKDEFAGFPEALDFADGFESGFGANMPVIFGVWFELEMSWSQHSWLSMSGGAGAQLPAPTILRQLLAKQLHYSFEIIVCQGIIFNSQDEVVVYRLWELLAVDLKAKAIADCRAIKERIMNWVKIIVEDAIFLVGLVVQQKVTNPALQAALENFVAAGAAVVALL